MPFTGSKRSLCRYDGRDGYGGYAEYEYEGGESEDYEDEEEGQRNECGWFFSARFSAHSSASGVVPSFLMGECDFQTTRRE